MARLARAALSVGVMLAVGCADRDASEGASSRVTSAVVGGTNDSGDDAVVSIRSTADASTQELCTGALVAPRVVVTAGHCTRDQAPETLMVGLGPDAQHPSQTLAVASVATFPTSGGQDLLAAGEDIGVLLLSADAPIAPLTLARDDSWLAAGSTAAIVGYGAVSAGAFDSAGPRRRAEVGVDGECATLVWFGNAMTNACEGDSGGPLLATAPDGSTLVVGVVSFGDYLSCTGPTYAVRVARYASWIDAIASGVADDACTGSCLPSAESCDTDAGTFDASRSAVGDGATPPTAGGGCSTTSRGGGPAHAAVVLGVALAFALGRRFRRMAR